MGIRFDTSPKNLSEVPEWYVTGLKYVLAQEDGCVHCPNYIARTLELKDNNELCHSDMCAYFLNIKTLACPCRTHREFPDFFKHPPLELALEFIEAWEAIYGEIEIDPTVKFD